MSNQVQPLKIADGFYGDGYDWSNLKSQIYGITDNNTIITKLNTYQKFPYILQQTFDINNSSSFYNATGDYGISLKNDLKTQDYLIEMYQKIKNMKDYGIMHGNAKYTEDKWQIQIAPVSFKYAYMDGTQLMLSERMQMRPRDKFIRIRVVYDGTDYAIVQAVKTLYNISYA